MADLRAADEFNFFDGRGFGGGGVGVGVRGSGFGVWGLEDGYTALHCAAESGHGDVIELLVKKGAEVEARTKKGVTAMQIAESLHYVGIARRLVHGGASRDDNVNNPSVVSAGYNTTSSLGFGDKNSKVDHFMEGEKGGLLKKKKKRIRGFRV
ncbi:hypothetical protein L484_011831 [Morus notabilis]|uniref:Uncharacterized protein n=1 Tax=Morus notabilis TaxID=981085 RepID=W9SEF8_9ROSA|nr:hypothetical protein L484_011831 [Morus notabilis]